MEEFSSLIGAAAPVVVDVDDRDAYKRSHWPGALNIPFDELEVRAGPELSRSRLLVIDGHLILLV